MSASDTKYFNPYTDFGFKKLFGEEGSKDLLQDFLNQLLPEHHQISTLKFKNTEALSEQITDRKAIFDIYCETADGVQFIVEMQKGRVQNFIDRALFYTSFPIREQSKKGQWDFNLMPVYFIGILDFIYDQKPAWRHFRLDVCLKDQYNAVFSDKLHFTFLQMPLFHKQADELETHFDKWIYFLKNLTSFDKIPAILNEPIFKKGFNIADISHLEVSQYEAYNNSLLDYWDVKSVENAAFDSGLEQGLEKGLEKGLEQGLEQGKFDANLNTVRALKKSGMALKDIAAIIDLNSSEFEALLNAL